MGYGEIYNTTWWGVALDTARTAGTEPDFFGSQIKLLTSEQDELVTNGDFSDGSNNWVHSDGATITDNGARIVSDGAYQRITQDNILTVGKQYKLQYEIVENNSGNLKAQTSFGISPIPSTVGVHTVYGEAAQTYLTIERNGVCDITIDNISVQLVRCDLEDIEAKKCLADWIHTTALKDLNN
tara:strand:+ start:592 stop:1140 length:549 start_codon:yes stop_codon:yes gene_type:complete